jgi:hypothetical protein
MRNLIAASLDRQGSEAAMDGLGGPTGFTILAIKMNADNQMKTIFALIIIFIVSSAGASEIEVKNVPLENGVGLQIKEIQPSRILPYAYYDQALASIPGVYPGSQIIAKRRLGYLGKITPVVYSIVCYKKSKDLKEVTISGVVTSKNKAWYFETEVDEFAFADTLILVMEIIAEVPFNKSLQPTGEQHR